MHLNPFPDTNTSAVFSQPMSKVWSTHCLNARQVLKFSHYATALRNVFLNKLLCAVPKMQMMIVELDSIELLKAIYEC
jgi:hypothetical protein